MAAPVIARCCPSYVTGSLQLSITVEHPEFRDPFVFNEEWIVGDIEDIVRDWVSQECAQRGVSVWKDDILVIFA